MLGVGKQCLLIGNFHDLAQVHHSYPTANVLDHAEVVSNEQIGEIQLVLQIHQQIENLGLDADIEGCHRLIADDKLGLHGKGTGDAHSLTLSTRHLVRVAVQEMVGQTNHSHQFR
jgi:hypothetical protein